MLIRIPRTFRAKDLPVTAVLSEDDLTELLEGIPGDAKAQDEEFSIHFDSPHAAADLVDALQGRIPYLAEDMDLNEEILFTSILKDRPLRPRTLDTKDKRARHFGIAGLSVGISSAVASAAALVLSIVALVH